MKREKTVDELAEKAIDSCPRCGSLTGAARAQRVAQIVADVRRKNPQMLTRADLIERVRDLTDPLDLTGRARDRFLSAAA